jgi:hypothetical protein
VAPNFLLSSPYINLKTRWLKSVLAMVHAIFLSRLLMSLFLGGPKHGMLGNFELQHIFLGSKMSHVGLKDDKDRFRG